jgi:hypothetical protein
MRARCCLPILSASSFSSESTLGDVALWHSLSAYPPPPRRVRRPRKAGGRAGWTARWGGVKQRTAVHPARRARGPAAPRRHLGVAELGRDKLLGPVHVGGDAELLAQREEDRVPVHLPPARRRGAQSRREAVFRPQSARQVSDLSHVSRIRVIRSRRPNPLRDKMSQDSACESPIIPSPMNVHLHSNDLQRIFSLNSRSRVAVLFQRTPS